MAAIGTHVHVETEHKIVDMTAEIGKKSVELLYVSPHPNAAPLQCSLSVFHAKTKLPDEITKAQFGFALLIT
jgi:hypothetical protein